MYVRSDASSLNAAPRCKDINNNNNDNGGKGNDTNGGGKHKPDDDGGGGEINVTVDAGLTLLGLPLWAWVCGIAGFLLLFSMVLVLAMYVGRQARSFVVLRQLSVQVDGEDSGLAMSHPLIARRTDV